MQCRSENDRFFTNLVSFSDPPQIIEFGGGQEIWAVAVGGEGEFSWIFKAEIWLTSRRCCRWTRFFQDFRTPPRKLEKCIAPDE